MDLDEDSPSMQREETVCLDSLQRDLYIQSFDRKASVTEGTIKYSLCYRPGALVKELAYMQCKRFFIEKSFREGKKELGLNEYQTRSAQGWHKHMAIIMLGQLFLNTQTLLYYIDSGAC